MLGIKGLASKMFWRIGPRGFRGRSDVKGVFKVWSTAGCKMLESWILVGVQSFFSLCVCCRISSISMFIFLYLSHYFSVH